ncbi:phage tail protein I [Calothrix sp. PCC 7507]|uniref:phage tail protein I n=1 Tax=Calothrix sp. PCC 7507 TaxID=99598 RepID=UPI00029EDAF1|nr:phage tail protein I [Calothrix sp. PCC 7507]AFY33618.1 phage tail protein [Calothrix sp. PCC 7507]
MNSKESESISSYQQYLPVILQQDAFIGQLLLAFEKILSGLKETPNIDKIITAESQSSPGLEAIIDNIHIYFNPQETPEDFLPWLAGWVALSLRDDWKVEVKREFIQQIVQLYRLRGTKEGLRKILSLYLEKSGFGKTVDIFDQFDNFPNYFQVQLTLTDRDPDKYWRQAKIAKAIIDREKPAHTFYTLKILVPTMQLTKRSQVLDPLIFKLFAPIQNQKFAIEATITPNDINSSQINQLAKQLLVQFQGNSKSITPSSQTITVNNQSFSVRQSLNYQHLQDNLSGLNVTLSNRNDKILVGNLTIKIYFYINDKEYNNTVLEQAINLSPVLKICLKNKAGEIIGGNTIVKKAIQPNQSEMKITESIWTKPYSFRLFEPPKIQELKPKIIAILEKIELEAIVEITEPNPIKPDDLLNKITVRLQDDVSEYHLLTPETTIENNKIIIKRTLYYQQFTQTIDKLEVTIKNLNNVKVAGKVIVQAYLTINQRSSAYKLLERDFNLADVPPYNILQICRKAGKVEESGGNTILGTTTQSLSKK